MKEVLSWFSKLMGLSSHDRKDLIEEIFSGIGEFSHLGEGSSDQSVGKDLEKELRKNFNVIGIIPNVSYVKPNGEKEDLEALWVHPFATPALLLSHKKLPILVISSGGLRFNDSVLNEMKHNEDKHILNGISG